MIRILGERFEVRIDAQTTDPDFEAIPQSDKYPLLNSHLRPKRQALPMMPLQPHLEIVPFHRVQPFTLRYTSRNPHLPHLTIRLERPQSNF